MNDQPRFDWIYDFFERHPRVLVTLCYAALVLCVGMLLAMVWIDGQARVTPEQWCQIHEGRETA